MVPPEKPGTTTITVFTRHSPDCLHKDNMYYRGKGCNCRKHLYIYENGKRKYRSANTRSWKRAEELAQAKRDRRNPVKRRLQEIADQETVKADEETAKAAAMRVKNITIASALDRWMATHKDIKEGTYKTHRTFIKKVGGWAERKKILYLRDITPDLLDEWRGSGPRTLNISTTEWTLRLNPTSKPA
jgi:hypothetical protein